MTKLENKISSFDWLASFVNQLVMFDIRYWRILGIDVLYFQCVILCLVFEKMKQQAKNGGKFLNCSFRGSLVAVSLI